MLRNIGLFIIKRLAIKKPQMRITIPFAQAKRIGVIVDNLDKNKNAINQFVADLEQQGKSVEVLGYTKPKQAPKLNIKYSAFSKKDFNWVGACKQDVLKNFVKTDFDYLFSLNTSSFLPFDNILAQSKAKCRVGVFNDKRTDYFELMVQPTKKGDLNSVAEQMIRYTKLI